MSNYLENILKNTQIENHSFFSFLSNYFYVLNSLIPNQNKSLIIYEEAFTLFLFKKIVFTVIQPLKSHLQSNDVIEFYKTLLKYFSKAIFNTSQLILLCLKDIKTNGIINFLITNLILLLNDVLTKNQNLLNFISNNNEIFMHVTRLIIETDISINKDYCQLQESEQLDSSFFDLFLSNLSEENLLSKISLQKSFSLNYIKTNLKEKLINIMNENKFQIEEGYHSIKLIIKDNFFFTLCFKKNKILFQNSLDNNFLFSINEIVNTFRSHYNEEIKLFTLKNNISRKKIIFLLDLSIKISLLINKLFKNNLVEEKVMYVLSEINKSVENYILIINKDLFANGLEALINLYKYEELIGLEESHISQIINQSKKTVDILFNELDELRVSIQSEDFIVNSMSIKIIERINEELSKSLKRIPQNKYFTYLTDKTLKVLDKIMNRYSLKPDTRNSIVTSISKLKSSFTSLIMNKI